MFGIAPDRHWYDEILANESSLCDEALSTMADAIRELGIGTIVTDAVEYFSPMHDLCNAIACAIVRAAAADGASIALLDYVNERPDLKQLSARNVISLDQTALARKNAAISSYYQLASDVDRRADHRQALATEQLFALDPFQEWPITPSEEPFYERFGRQRIDEGRYDRLITYSRHVRPLASSLMERSTKAIGP